MTKAYILFVSILITSSAFGVTCPSGQDAVTGADSSTFVSIDSAGHCPPGYAVYDSPSHLGAYFSGLLLSDTVTLCDSGQYMSDGVCTSYAQGRCDSGYSEVTTASSTVGAIDSTGHCQGGYATQTIPTGSYIISTGALLASGATLCDSGQYMSDGVCTSYDNARCPTGWINYASGTDSTFVPPSADTCGTNYNSVAGFVDCQEIGNEEFCVSPCATGEGLTYGGQCVELCGIGITKLRVGALEFPIYATKTTDRALNIKIEDSDVCHINLASGTASDSLNIKDDNGTAYHTTK